MDKTRLFEIPILGRRYFKKVIEFEGGEMYSNTLREYTRKRYYVSVGLYSYGGVFATDFNIGGKRVDVGNYGSFASSIYYYGANHPFHHATMSPLFYNKVFGFDVKDVERSSLNIGHDVWIGYGTIITSGCKLIGNGAVIGAGSVVTKDVPPYTIIAGTPAAIIRKRFDEDTITCLENSKWWELPPSVLYQFYDSIDDPDVWATRIINYRKSKQLEL